MTDVFGEIPLCEDRERRRVVRWQGPFATNAEPTFDGLTHRHGRLPVRGLRRDFYASTFANAFGICFTAAAGSEYETKITVVGPPFALPKAGLTTGPSPFELSLAETDLEHFTAEILNPAVARPAQILLKLKPGAPVGRVRDSLVIRTNIAGEEEVVIPIFGEITQGG